MKQDDFLFEIFTEEIPPHRLRILSETLSSGIQKGLVREGLLFDAVLPFATPRRLAVWVKDLSEKQPQQKIERQGPSVASAFDSSGKPTKACLGFAAGCGVAVAELKRQKTERGEYLFFNKEEPGRTVFDLLPEIVTEAIRNLPIAKPMRWGASDAAFVRPVHAVIMLYGQQVIPAEILGIKAGNQTFGHRFLCLDPIIIPSPKVYLSFLREKGFVFADFEVRKTIISQQVLSLIEKVYGVPVIDSGLLEDVAAMVEWPSAILASFDASFLRIPKEALVCFIEKHQKCFPVFDEKGEVKPYFVAVANIESQDPDQVIKGNERVMLARLSDAMFFYELDLKIPLEERVLGLKNIRFQDNLGTLFDKTQRVMLLTKGFAEEIGAKIEDAERAAFLAKADLLTDMVGEFPDLQGVMGKYYARAGKESGVVALALAEQYLPRFSGDILPETNAGMALALSDRLDTMVGLFGVNKGPTGERDPFGLRRAAIGVIRIITEAKEPLTFDLLRFLMLAKKGYGDVLPNPDVIQQVFDFISERFKIILMEKGFLPDEIQAVAVNNITDLTDFIHRVIAVKSFRTLPEAESLSMANKRVTNILSKESVALLYQSVDRDLLQEESEKILAELIIEKTKTIEQLYQETQYIALFKELTVFYNPINAFFDHVMIMVDDEKIRRNRLTLLANLKKLFSFVADISLLR